jgi:predicted peptidase
MKTASLTTLLVIAVLTGCTIESEFPATNDSFGELRLGDNTMFYGLTLPDSYSPGRPTPLILALHYGGSFSDYYGKTFARNYVEPALEDLDAIIISPTCPATNWTTSASEEAVLALIEHIKTTHSVDGERILITGYSLGAIGTWYLAARHPHLFTAALPVSGSGMSGYEDMLRDFRCPVYVIHSRNDEILPFSAVENLVRMLRNWGISVHFEDISGPTHYETASFIPHMKAAVPWIRSVWHD